MILTCPECGARYRLADTAIPPAGRTVQCASCKHSWFEPGTDTPPPAAVPAATSTIERVQAPIAPRFEPPSPPAATARPASSWWPTLAALLASALLTVLAAAVWRDDLARLGIEMPLEARRTASARLTSTPLLVNATVELRVLASGGNFMAVNGTITNPTKTAQPVVDLVAEVLDSNGKIIDSWIIPAPIGMLPGGRVVAFDSAASNIPAGAASLSVRFAGIETKP